MKLSNYCTISSSKEIYACEYTESGIPFYRVKEISEMANGNFDFEKVYISKERFEELKAKYYIPSEKDILITAAGTIGNIYVVQKDDVFYFRDSLLLSNFSKEINPYYIYLYLQFPHVQNYLKNISNYSIQKHITIGMLRNIDINIPSLQKQNEICKIIKTNEDLYKNNLKIIKLLTNKIKDIYSFYFHAFIDKNKLTFSKEVNMNIPLDYSLVNIEDILTFEKGFEPTSKSYIDSPEDTKNLIKFYRVGDMNSDSTTYIKNNLAINLCKEEDILVAFDASIGRINFGLNGSYSSGIQKVKFKDSEIDNCLAFAIMNDDRIQQILLNGSNNSIIKHASNLKKYIFIPFKKDDYIKVSRIIKPFYEALILLKKQNKQLKNIKECILKGLFQNKFSRYE